eukprot:COSAG01_NODE_71_length_28648_cov_1587.432449_7_plen_92_part_00
MNKNKTTLKGFNRAYLTPIKDKQFQAFCKKMIPYVKNFPDRVALLKVMAVMKLEGILPSVLKAKDYKKIQVLKGALMLKEKGQKNLDGQVK